LDYLKRGIGVRSGDESDQPLRGSTPLNRGVGLTT
jgi:hypothetical protein